MTFFYSNPVAERPDDIDDMATLVQTGLDFEVIENDIIDTGERDWFQRSQ